MCSLAHVEHYGKPRRKKEDLSFYLPGCEVRPGGEKSWSRVELGKWPWIGTLGAETKDARIQRTNRIGKSQGGAGQDPSRWEEATLPAPESPVECAL